MIRPRLELALKQLAPSDWNRFESLASAFLASEFEALRTMASPAGDEGRDAELFSPEGEPTVVLQYSVTDKWRDKIQKTAKRLSGTHPKARVLIYITNQSIGAVADNLRRSLRREQGLTLDIRDRNWFLDRVLGDPGREQAAEELSRLIVDPLLATSGIGPRTTSELTSPESVAALTFLSLQWRDDVREKGLTKLAFEALVRAALIGTNSENRVRRQAVKQRVGALLPGHASTQVDTYVDSALKRLTKKAIRHWQTQDEFCLTYEEVQRVNDFKVQQAIAESELEGALKDLITIVVEAHDAPLEFVGIITTSARRVIEEFMLERSQSFALSVHSGVISGLAFDGLHDAIVRQIGSLHLPSVVGVDWVGLLEGGVREILLGDQQAIQTHLRSLVDAYTLLAFLRQAPDVQSAIEKIFSHGQIWLDASIILPLISETLDEEVPGRFTRMIRAAQEAGLELFVTGGVLEEVEHHMSLALACARIQERAWYGNIPFLLSRYVESGRSPQAFSEWLENFRGPRRPEDDLADYLKEELNIARRDLAEQSDAADSSIRFTLQQLWYEAHKRRRQEGDINEMALLRLVKHDVECYCGVMQLRTKQKNFSFGYDAWWLTLDQKAFNLHAELAASLQSKQVDSPVLSADFLVNYLAFGPVRRKITKATEARLPLLMEANVRYLTPEILKEAEEVRESISGAPQRIVRRRIRELLDQAKRRLGPIALAGGHDLDDEVVTT